MKKMKIIAMLTAFALTASLATAQELPRKVSNIEILDLNGKPAKLPHFGEKNLMIFYVTSRTTTSRLSSSARTGPRAKTSTDSAS